MLVKMKLNFLKLDFKRIPIVKDLFYIRLQAKIHREISALAGFQLLLGISAAYWISYLSPSTER